MMDTLIARYTEQLAEALEIGEKAEITPAENIIQNIYVAGLGGSGIGADFVKEIIRKTCKVPITVGKGYHIPEFIGPNSLAIVSSYSGNTEETISSFEKLKETGAKIVVVSSGGKLIAAAQELDLDYIQLPGNWPSPRACLGYSLVQQLFVLQKLGLIDDQYTKQIASSISLLDQYKDEIKEEAMSIAKKLHGKIPIIYIEGRMESVAVRLRQQINENSKMLCWHHVIPEMNHNELVGWRDKRDEWAVLYLRNEDDYNRNQVRMEINQKIISKYSDTILEIWSKGNNFVEQAMYLVNIGDWISFYLSEMHGVDSIEIDVIDYLKGELAKV